MVILDEQKIRLSNFGCECLARTAAYHNRELKAEDGKENQDPNDVELQRMITRLCAVSPSFTRTFNQIFPKNSKNGATFKFSDECAEISFQQFSLKFTQCEDLVFFLEMVRPYFRLIHYSGSFFWRKHLIKIAEALVGKNGGNIYNSQTFLKFDKLGNDNAYGTLLEYLGPNVRRIELDDEFVPSVRDEATSFNFLKIKSQSRSDMYYTKSYFDVDSKVYDLRNVCSLGTMIIYTFEMFNLRPKPDVEKVSMSYFDEPVETVQQGAEYIQRLLPNLKRLSLVQGKALLFSNPDNAFQAGREINRFLTETYQQKIAGNFELVDLDVKLDLSIYAKDNALNNKIDWVAELKKDFPDLTRVTTEFETTALQVVFPGNKDGDSVIVHVHANEKEYNESEPNNWPHPTPNPID